jgi:hypothetical protein
MRTIIFSLLIYLGNSLIKPVTIDTSSINSVGVFAIILPVTILMDLIDLSRSYRR